MKKFLISIDTEGDNLWAWRAGDKITTENAHFLPRFQELCESYGFKPTYLTNYEMATDSFFIDYFKSKNLNGQCEIGMHLHAWNSPPTYELPIRNDIKPGAPYLIEYPKDIMLKKIDMMTKVIEDRFDYHPVTHRAGRWATNDTYFELLNEFGYKIDCSVTPGKNWESAPGQTSGSCGSNYLNEAKYPYRIPNTDIIEIPVTIRENHRLKLGKNAGVRKTIRKYLDAKKGQGLVWLRPKNRADNLSDMLYLAEKISSEKKADYLMFMLHSSELMPGGSPNFKSEESIENLYSNLKGLFNTVSQKYYGVSFRDYYEEMQNNGKLKI